SKLKSGRTVNLPDIKKAKDQWDVYRHRTMIDKHYLPDKPVKNEHGQTTIQPVNRIAIPFQKKIVNTAVSFAFGIPVSYNADPDGEAEETIYEAVKAVVRDAKLDAFSR